MTQKPEHPPAFPHIKRLKAESMAASSFTPEYSGGMTLRDYFAGQAICGIVGKELTNTQWAVMPDLENVLAKSAYIIADAMLAARSKP